MLVWRNITRRCPPTPHYLCGCIQYTSSLHTTAPVTICASPLLQDNRKRVNDRVRLYVAGGTGGKGCATTGGIGGKGGGVYVKTLKGATLATYGKKPSPRMIGGHGSHSTRKQHKAVHGKDRVLPVPPGTVITAATDPPRVIVDLDKPDVRALIAKGGASGNAQRKWIGERGERFNVYFELKLIADVALVGFPNAGKSTLLGAISSSKPEVGHYPFTTINPMVGQIPFEDGKNVTVADLPGLIEGAHEKRGMGHRFLRHVERTKALALVVDINGFQLKADQPHRSPVEMVTLLMRELVLYRDTFMNSPMVLVVNKMDMEDSAQKLDALREDLLDPPLPFLDTPINQGASNNAPSDDSSSDDSLASLIRENCRHLVEKVIPLSAKRGDGVDAFKEALYKLMHTADHSDDNDTDLENSGTVDRQGSDDVREGVWM